MVDWGSLPCGGGVAPDNTEEGAMSQHSLRKTLNPNPHLLSVLVMQGKGYQYRRMENSESKPASTECVSHTEERLSV